MSRYSEENNDVEQVCTLGDHVGGSAIRALALVSTPYLVNSDGSVSSVAELTDWKDSTNGHGFGVKGKQELLFSAGAKEIWTCWLVDWPPDVNEEMASISLKDGTGQLPQEDQEGSTEQRDPTPRWLCSYSRQKILPPAAIASAGGAKAFDIQCSQDEHDRPKNQKSKQGSFQRSGHIDDDHRYLCLTAFATRCVKTGTMFSFVGTASSNASLHLYACLTEMHIESALLDSPAVLSTSVDNAASATGVNRERGIPERDHSTDSLVTEQISSKVEIHEERADPKLSLVLRPFEEIKAAHQSGINCLSVAKLQRHRCLADEKFIYTVISGGDDQALHIAIFAIDWEITDYSRRRSGEGFPDVREGHALHLRSAEGKTSPGFHILSRSMIQSAHSSAVKGVWTDGEWAFSTGLDQRLRIWRIQLDGICTASEQKRVTDQSGLEETTPLLEEFVTFVIDVPEPASLDASVGPDGRYQIAVVGRGLQLINFDSNL